MASQSYVSMQYTNEANMERIIQALELSEFRVYGMRLKDATGWEFIGMMTDNEFILELLTELNPKFYMLLRYEEGQIGDGYFVETIADIYEPWCLQMEINGKLYNVLKSTEINLSL